MNIFKISIQNLKSKPLYTFLSILVLTLSIALLLGVQQLKTSFEHQMNNNLGEIDLVLGAKGSPLQLVLASVLHIDNPTGNISYKEAKKIGSNPMIKTAIPISYGDNYKGFKIVGTTLEFPDIYKATIQKGRYFKKSMEVVLGSSVAEQLNLKIGDTFLSSHGLIENEIDVHDHAPLKVVGILQPTQKVIDRLIISNLESIWDVHHHKEGVAHEENYTDKHDKAHEDGHTHDEHQNNDGEHKKSHAKNNSDEHDDEKEITSLLITFRNPVALLTLPRKINKDTNMQAALPKYELDRLYEYTGVGFKTVSLIAYLILIISGITIFISLYKMVKERAFDLALLRTYGASNLQLIKMVTYEGLVIILIAFISGFLLVKVGLYFIFELLTTNYKQNILQELSLQEAFQIGGLVFVMVILSIILAIYPIVKMNVSTILSNEK